MMRNITVHGYSADRISGPRVCVHLHMDDVGLLTVVSVHLSAADARELAAELLSQADVASKDQ